MKSAIKHGIILVVGLAQVAASANSYAAPTIAIEWIEQFGTSSFDTGRGVTIDASRNVYVTGGSSFLRKFDPIGNLLWAKQVSGANTWAVSADSLDNVYVSGATRYGDAFVRKYSSDGDIVWDRFFASGGALPQVGISVTGIGDVFISGVINDNGNRDRFLAKFNSIGDFLWSEQFGSNVLDYGWGVAADAAGNAYVTGSTDGSLVRGNVGRRDLFIKKYDSAGNLQWTHQDGTAFDDVPQGASVDIDGNIYITGYTQNGSLDGGVPLNYDAFTRKLDSDGNVLWTSQLRSSGGDYGLGVAADPSGGVHITGRTNGSLEGSHQGGWDAFRAFYDSEGVLISVDQFGTSANDELWGAFASASGELAFTGFTHGILGDEGFGSADAFVVKAVVIPEPTTNLLAIFAILLTFSRWSVHRELFFPASLVSYRP